MKGRLVTNGILSIVTGIGTIIFIATFVSAVTQALQGTTDLNALVGGAVSLIFFMYIPGFASLVMGIVTLSTQKHQAVQGLTIASGILAIFGGMFFVNAIVSFIAVAKINKFENQPKLQNNEQN